MKYINKIMCLKKYINTKLITKNIAWMYLYYNKILQLIEFLMCEFIIIWYYSELWNINIWYIVSVTIYQIIYM